MTDKELCEAVAKEVLGCDKFSHGYLDIEVSIDNVEQPLVWLLTGDGMLRVIHRMNELRLDVNLHCYSLSTGIEPDVEVWNNYKSSIVTAKDKSLPRAVLLASLAAVRAQKETKQ